MEQGFGGEVILYQEGEGRPALEVQLDRRAVVARSATTAADGKTYQVEHFNLDAILSVGYRVNSRRGTQFRLWATRVLREHLVRGYTVNEGRLRELGQTVRLVADLAERHKLAGAEAAAVLRVVADYAYALGVLDDYDHERARAIDLSSGAVASVSAE